MTRPILKLGATPLLEPARPVPAITPEVLGILEEMVETMYAAPGIGLAAPQIGVPLRMFVVDLQAGGPGGHASVFINPEIVERDGLQLEEEGCLSVPGFTATVLRPARLVVSALDRDGQTRRVEGHGLMARALQHELDHLDGLLYVHRLRGIRRALIERHVRRLEHLGRW